MMNLILISTLPLIVYGFLLSRASTLFTHVLHQSTTDLDGEILRRVDKWAHVAEKLLLTHGHDQWQFALRHAHKVVLDRHDQKIASLTEEFGQTHEELLGQHAARAGEWKAQCRVQGLRKSYIVVFSQAEPISEWSSVAHKQTCTKLTFTSHH